MLLLLLATGALPAAAKLPDGPTTPARHAGSRQCERRELRRSLGGVIDHPRRVPVLPRRGKTISDTKQFDVTVDRARYEARAIEGPLPREPHHVIEVRVGLLAQRPLRDVAADHRAVLEAVA